MAFQAENLNLEATELRLGLPGTKEIDQQKTNNKRALPIEHETKPPPSKAQVVGWPPVRSNRRNCFSAKKIEGESGANYVKVSMDGAPYLRKMDLKVYKGYAELLKALEDMFKFKVGEYSEKELGYNNRCEFVPTYEDKDGDWMLLGDVPWEMFFASCKRVRIMKGSEAKGLGGVVAEKKYRGEDFCGCE